MDNDLAEWRLIDTDYTTHLAILPTISSHTDAILNDVGAGELRFPLDTTAAALVAAKQYAALYYRGAYRGGFIVDNIAEDQAGLNEGSGRIMKLSGRGALALLDAEIIHGDGTTNQTREFASKTKAYILKTLIDEAQTRGGLTALTYDFTAVVDSAAVAWTDSEDYKLNVGMSLLDLVRDFAKTGIEFDITYSGTGFVFSAYKNGIGTDLSSTIKFRVGTNCVEVATDQRNDELVNAYLVKWKDGYIKVEDATSIAAYGRHEKLLSLEMAQTPASATTYASALLEDTKDPKKGINVRVTDAVNPRLYIDYDIGDYIKLDVFGVETKYRVLGLQPEFSGAQFADVVVNLNNILYDKDLKMKSDLDWLLNQWNSAHDANLLAVSYWAAIGGENTNGAVNVKKVSGTKIYVGGDFTQIGGISANCIAYYDTETGLWSALGTGLSGTVAGGTTTCYGITIIGTDIYACGNFSSAGGVSVSCVAKYNGSAWADMGGGVNNHAYAIDNDGTNVYVGGAFGQAGGAAAAGYISKWNGAAWSDLGTGLDYHVLAIYVISANDIYAGGKHTAGEYIQHWGGASWAALGSGVNNEVYAITGSGTDIYVGGIFTTAGGTTVNCIAKWDSVGSAWSALGSGVTVSAGTASVKGIAIYLTDVFIVGNFDNVGNYIAKYSGGNWYKFEDGLDNTGYTIALINSDVYVGGAFLNANGKPAKYIAAYFNTFQSALDYLENAGNTFDMGAAIKNAPESAITDSDKVPFWESVADALRSITWANIKATLLGNTADTQILYNNGGALDSDPALTFDDTNKTLVVGDIDTTLPNAAGSIIQGADGTSVANFLESFGANVASYITFMRGGGTHAAPTAVQADYVLGRIRGRGYDGNGASSSTSTEIRMVANETHSSTNHGTRVEIHTTPDGDTTLTKVLTIGNRGEIEFVSLAVRVVNSTGATLTENTAVYVNGAQGNRPTIAKAKADAESTSHGMLGFVFDDIANNAEGLMLIFGIKDGFDTSGFTAGDTLYQSAATAGAVTNVAPTAPNHRTVMGFALNSTVNGRIAIRPQSGFEIGELHDVSTAGVADEYVMYYDNATGLYKFKSLLTSAQAADLTDGLATTLHNHAGLVTAETNTNDIFRCDNPGGVSAFVGTIATLPGGAVLTYNVTSGQEGAMVPVSTSQLAKMRLYNSTRGTNALISNCVTGTNTVTLTANVPAGWQVGDTITIASTTVSGTDSWVDFEITSGPTGKTSLFIQTIIVSATVGDTLRLHPTETFAASKQMNLTAQVANTSINGWPLVKMTSNVFSCAWTGTPSAIVVREVGSIQ